MALQPKFFTVFTTAFIVYLKFTKYTFFFIGFFFSDSVLQNQQSVNEKIEALELNLKRLENELMVENNKLANENESLLSVANDRPTQSDESTADTNTGTSHKIIDKYLSTTVKKHKYIFDKRLLQFFICFSDGMSRRIETDGYSFTEQFRCPRDDFRPGN